MGEFENQAIERLAKIEVALENSGEDIAEIRAGVRAINRSLDGNGGPGIKTRLHHLENRCDSFNQRLANRTKWFWLGLTFITGVIAAAAAVVEAIT